MTDSKPKSKKQILLKNSRHNTEYPLTIHGDHVFLTELDVVRINRVLCPTGCCVARRVLCDRPAVTEMAGYIDGLYLMEKRP